MADKKNEFKIVALHEQPGANEIFFAQKERIWSEFMFRDVYTDKLWSYALTVFDEFQLYLLNESGDPIAVGQSMPCEAQADRPAPTVRIDDTIKF